MTVKSFRSPVLSRYHKDGGAMRVCGLLPGRRCTLILSSPLWHI